MADEELRRLEREAAAGDPEAKARLKVAYARVEDRAVLRRWKLAAYLGNEVARERVDPAEKTELSQHAWAAAAQAKRQPTSFDQLGVPEHQGGLLTRQQLVLEFGFLHPHTLARLACELGERSLSRAGAYRDMCREVYEALQAWLERPSAAAKKRLSAARSVLYHDPGLDVESRASPQQAAAAAIEAARAALKQEQAPARARACAGHAAAAAAAPLAEVRWQCAHVAQRLAEPGWGLPEGGHDPFGDLAPYVPRGAAAANEEDAMAARIRALLDAASLPSDEAGSEPATGDVASPGSPPPPSDRPPDAESFQRWLEDARDRLLEEFAATVGAEREEPSLGPLVTMLRTLLAQPTGRLYGLADHECAEVGWVRKDAQTKQRAWAGIALVARLRGTVAIGLTSRTRYTRFAPSTGWKELKGLARQSAFRQDRALAAWADAQGDDRIHVPLEVAQEFLASFEPTLEPLRDSAPTTPKRAASPPSRLSPWQRGLVAVVEAGSAQAERWPSVLTAWGVDAFGWVLIAAAEAAGEGALRELALAWCRSRDPADAREIQAFGKRRPSTLATACGMPALIAAGNSKRLVAATHALRGSYAGLDAAFAHLVQTTPLRLRACPWRARAVARALLDPREEARALRWRLERGALERDDLELAAELGDPAAELALGGEVPGLRRPYDLFVELKRGPEQRVAVAWARAKLDVLELKRGPLPALAQAVEAAERIVLEGADPEPLRSALAALDTPVGPGLLRARALLLRCLERVADPDGQALSELGRALERGFPNQHEARRVMARALVPHLLGAGEIEAPDEAPALGGGATVKQLRFLRRLMILKGVYDEQLAEQYLPPLGAARLNELSLAQASQLIDTLRALEDWRDQLR